MDFKLWLSMLDYEHMTREQIAEAAWKASLSVKREFQQPDVVRRGMFHDHQADMIDDMAALCANWERNRQKGRIPKAIREAIIILAKDIVASQEVVNPIPRPDPEKRTI